MKEDLNRHIPLFRLEVHIVLGLQPYDTQQLHVLNVFNFKPASTLWRLFSTVLLFKK